MGKDRKRKHKTAINKFLNKLSPLERLAIVMSTLYSLGMTVLVQYNSEMLGTTLVDYLRLKPILVGISYVVYLLIPAALIVVPPFLMTRKKNLRLGGKIGFLFFYVSIVALGVPMMMSYFFPFMRYAYLGTCAWRYWFSCFAAFWPMYWSADAMYFIGMGCWLLASLLIAEQVAERNLLPWLPWRNSRTAPSLLLVLGMGILIFYFNHNVYRNLSQSIGGGAPIAGIMTLKKHVPPPSGASVSTAVSQASVEKTFPCWLFSTDGGRYSYCAMRSEVFPYTVDPDVSLDGSSVSSDMVVEFVSLPYCLRHDYDGFRTICGNFCLESVHRLDVFVKLVFRKGASKHPAEDVAVERLTRQTNRWDDVRLQMKISNLPTMESGIGSLDAQEKGDGSLEIYLGFTGIPIPSGIKMSRLGGAVELGQVRLALRHVSPDEDFELIGAYTIVRGNYLNEFALKDMEYCVMEDGSIQGTRCER